MRPCQIMKARVHNLKTTTPMLISQLLLQCRGATYFHIKSTLYQYKYTIYL